MLGRSVLVRLGAHADQAVAQAALQRADRLPFQAIDRIAGGVALRDSVAGKAAAPVVVVALGAGVIDLTQAGFEQFSPGLDERL